MRILFATTRGAGHLGPLIPLRQACRRAGHEVLVAAPGSVAPHVERAGLPLAPLDDPDEQAMQPIWQRVRAARLGEADQIVLEEIFAGEFARSALPGMLATMRAWRPDVVLRESTEFASLVAAEQLGVPHLHVAVFLAAGGEVRLGAPRRSDRAAAHRGRTESRRPIGAALAGAVCDLGAAFAGGPVHRAAPGTPLGPRAGRARATASDWWEGSHEPLVYVSFGSAAAGNGFYPDLYREALEALDGLPARVLLTLGTDVDPAELGPRRPRSMSSRGSRRTT